jgi:hypothetical protein
MIADRVLELPEDNDSLLQYMGSWYKAHWGHWHVHDRTYCPSYAFGQCTVHYEKRSCKGYKTFQYAPVKTFQYALSHPR